MDIEKIIINLLNKKGTIKTSDVVDITGFSRGYVSKAFRKLREQGKVILLGKANKAVYIPATEEGFKKSKEKILKTSRILKNKNLSEDIVLSDIKKNTGIFSHLTKNIYDITVYSFLEMLNNAIEHSQSDSINVNIEKTNTNILFTVEDYGVGIFNNIMQKKNLKSVEEALQDLLKGKQTTAPQAHTGEGVFFTSKLASILTIKSFQKKLIFNNIIDDIFVKDAKNIKGTSVSFSLDLNSTLKIEDIFAEYSDDSFEFSKTEVRVKLYKQKSENISRSQARRILAGLEKFKTIILDFDKVDTVGQGFADEVFRVWKNLYPDIDVHIENANENVKFMINHVFGNIK